MAISESALALLRNSLAKSEFDMTFNTSDMKWFNLCEQSPESGDFVKVTIDVDLGGGSSAVAATAYANATNTKRVAFAVPQYKNYGFTTIDLSDSNLTKGDNAAAFFLGAESKKALGKAQKGVSVALAGLGYGELNGSGNGVCTNPSGSTWTVVMASEGEANNFRPNQRVVQKTTLSAASLNTGTGLITGVDGLTVTLTAESGFTPTAGRFMGEQGTMIASASPSVWPGFLSIIPPYNARPQAAESFMGVDRTINSTKLAGHYLDGRSLSLLAGINKLAYKINNTSGAAVDTLLCSSTTQGRIVAACQAQRKYVNQTKIAGTNGVMVPVTQIEGPTGPMDIVAMPNWPDTQIGLATRSTWHVKAPLGKPFQPATSNGTPIVEVPGDDVAVAKYRAQFWHYCDAPGVNGTLTIAAQ